MRRFAGGSSRTRLRLPRPSPLAASSCGSCPGQGGLSALDGGRPQTVFANGREYSSGETLVTEGANAQYLIDGGFCEIVNRLPAKKRERAKLGDTGHGE